MRYHSMAALRFFFPWFFVEISKTTISSVSFRSEWYVEKRNIECWLEKYFTVNISFLKTCRIRIYRHPRDFMLAAFPQWCTILWKGSFNEWNLLIVIVWESYRWNVKDKNILREINVLSKGCFCLLLYSGFTNVLALKHMCKCTC